MTPINDFDSFEQHAVIKVCGVGGGGGNAVNRMIEADLKNVDFIAINTDAQDLKKSLAATRLQIGAGLGAGAKPAVGREACEADRERVREVIQGADMVFLALGLGGGTGTGAAPVVAEEAAKTGALIVAIVTLPFSFEGEDRMDNAIHGLEELEKHVDTLIVVPNDRIAELSDNNTSLIDAFRHGDEVLHNGVRAISELITEPGLINLDFADVRTVMEARGRALMGVGIAEGEDRAIRAAQEAINCPLLEQSNISGAKSVVVNVRGGKTDLLMQEVQQANAYIKENAGPGANIIAGAITDEGERAEIQVTVIAAGFPKKDPLAYRNRASEEDKKKAAATANPPKAAATVKVATPVETPAPKTLPPVTDRDDLFNHTESDIEVPALTTPYLDEGEDLTIPTFLRKKMAGKKR